MGKKFKNNNNVVITPIKEVYEPKIKNSKNENAYGILLHTRKSIEEFQINSGMQGVYKKEYQHHYWAANARLAVDGQVLDISIPLILFNYDQVVSGGDIKFDLVEVEKVSNALQDAAIAKFKELKETKIYKYIADTVGITDWQIIPLNTAHVHPGGKHQTFSGIDLRTDFKYPGVVYPLSKGVMIPSFSAIMAHIDGVCQTVHSEYRLFNQAENGDKIYAHGRCATLVSGYIPEPLPRVVQPEPVTQKIIDKIFNITPVQPKEIEQKEAEPRKSFILKNLLGYTDGDEFLKELANVWEETVYDPDTTMIKKENIKTVAPVVRTNYYGQGNQQNLWNNQKKDGGDETDDKELSLFDKKQAIVNYEIATWAELQGQDTKDIQDLYAMVQLAEKQEEEEVEAEDPADWTRREMIVFLEGQGWELSDLGSMTDNALRMTIIAEQIEEPEEREKEEFSKDEAIQYLLKYGYKRQHLDICTDEKLLEFLKKEKKENDDNRPPVSRMAVRYNGTGYDLDEIEKIRVLLEEEQYLSFAKIMQMSELNIVAYYQQFYQKPGED